jgi:hypothetical protein
MFRSPQRKQGTGKLLSLLALRATVAHSARYKSEPVNNPG